jgi:hypothetical protein
MAASPGTNLRACLLSHRFSHLTVVLSNPFASWETVLGFEYIRENLFAWSCALFCHSIRCCSA